eukprot:scaffold916_cov516-Prasinococcus_capsulatus_cf.AAC.14
MRGGVSRRHGGAGVVARHRCLSSIAAARAGACSAGALPHVWRSMQGGMLCRGGGRSVPGRAASPAPAPPARRRSAARWTPCCPRRQAARAARRRTASATRWVSVGSSCARARRRIRSPGR